MWYLNLLSKTLTRNRHLLMTDLLQTPHPNAFHHLSPPLPNPIWPLRVRPQPSSHLLSSCYLQPQMHLNLVKDNLPPPLRLCRSRIGIRMLDLNHHHHRLLKPWVYNHLVLGPIYLVHSNLDLLEPAATQPPYLQHLRT